MKKNIVKTFSSIFIITLAVKVLGLLRDIFFAKYYGTGYVASAYLAATRIPTQLLDIGLGAAITSTFIPMFNKILQNYGKEKANDFAGNFINIIATLATLISVVGIIFAPQVVNLLAGGFDERTFNLTVELIRITFPMIIFTAIAYSFVGFLQSYGNFNIPAMISGISNLAIIIFLVLFREKFGIHGVATFMLIAWALQVIVQLPSALKNGYRFKFRMNFKDENIKKVFLLAIPIIISTSVLPINNLVSTRLASGMGESMVAALDYSYKLYIVIVGVISYAIGNILFPELSRLISSDNKEKFIEIINKSIRILSYILIPLTVGIILYRSDLIRVIYQRGEFNEISTMLTSTALLFYSIGMIGFGIVEVMNKSFYSMQDANTPLKVGIIVVICNVILSIVLAKFLNFKGLALSTAITSIINAVILIIFANRKNKGIINKEIFKTIFKNIVSAYIMGTCVYLINNILGTNTTMIFSIIKMGIGAISGIIIYYLFTLLLEVEESNIPIEYIKNKFKKN